MTQTVIGIFKDSGEAKSARQHLLSNGFRDENVDISAQSDSSNSSTTENLSDGGQDFGDKISHFFKNLFSDDDDKASNYSRAASNGIVVTVHAQSSDEAETAADILDDYGAVDVDEYGSGFNESSTSQTYNRDSSMDRTSNFNSTSDANYGSSSGMSSDGSNSIMESDTENLMDSNRNDNTDNDSISVIEEDLQVEKKEVETGGKRLRSRIVERPVEETIRLREEHVRIERNPVNRVATDNELSGLKDETIEITERSEIPVINKEARVVEEINISKDVEEKEQTITDTVRHTEVDIDDLDSNNQTRRSDSTNFTDSDDEVRR